MTRHAARALTRLVLVTSLLAPHAAFAEPAPPPAEAQGDAAAPAPPPPAPPPPATPPPKGPDAAHRVIVPEAGARLEAAFKRAAKRGWKLEGAKIDKATVTAKVCYGSACRDLRLSDPKAPCPGEVHGPWCAEWRPHLPPPGIPIAALFSALAADPDSHYWRTIAARPKQPKYVPPEQHEDLGKDATETAAGVEGGGEGAGAEAGPTEGQAGAQAHDGAAANTAAKAPRPAKEPKAESPPPGTDTTKHHAPAAEHKAPEHLSGEALAKPEPMDAPFSSTTSRTLGVALLVLVLALFGMVWWMRREVTDGYGRKRKRNPGLIAYLWLGPHVLMGLWLTFVPDTTAFTANQVITLVHVVLGLLMTPPIVWYSWVHIKKTWSAATGPTHLATIGKHGATIAVLGALVSGIVVLWFGEGMPAGTAHMVFGVVCAVALLLHLVTLTIRQLMGLTAWSLGGAIFIALLTWLVAPQDTWAPDSPDFQFKERPLALYDSAAWCGDCHTEFYNEWRRSVHGSTFTGHDVQHEQRPLQAKGFFRFGLTDVGRVVRGGTAHGRSPTDKASKFGVCSMCHAPTMYYGQSDRDGPFGAEPPISDAVSCSFCHTLRGVRDTPHSIASASSGAPGSKDGLDLSKAFQIAPFYNSAPETVRRYIGQGSKDPVARWVGDRIINWRSEMHRQDYHSEFLDTSAVCQGCHGLGLDGTIHGTYVDWRESEFGKRTAERDAVTCQDCHMARKMTGKPVSEPGRHVTWGPVRKRRTTHLFTGGNANWSSRYADQATADHQRKWNSKSIELSVTAVEQLAGAVRVGFQVRTPLIGHDFPSMETVLRYAWAEVHVFDARGARIASTYPWDGGHFHGKPDAVKDKPDVVMSPLFYRSEGYPEDGSEDTVIPANGKRDLVVRLPVKTAPGKPAPVVKTVKVHVYNSWDKLPMATISASLPLAKAAPSKPKTVGQRAP